MRLGSMGLVLGGGSFIVEIQLVVDGGERCCWVGMHSIAGGVHVIGSLRRDLGALCFKQMQMGQGRIGIPGITRSLIWKEAHFRTELAVSFGILWLHARITFVHDVFLLLGVPRHNCSVLKFLVGSYFSQRTCTVMQACGCRTLRVCGCQLHLDELPSN